uniref:rab GTPase-binding effector protein 2 isoform X2 n=1 Tax=Gasterosteus aculeatus aculeatus TaxID=481459 RepID=UPI001A9A020A|nr:rab GTPase-binding effector protein 2 isoform X2 [Gasterosteus aculeatus aculeatus]
MSSRAGDAETSLQAQLAEYRAQAEHWQGVATICELSKQEELAELQKQCDQEIQSLQEALRETASQYEARISVLQSQPGEWRRPSGPNTIGGRRVRTDAESASNGSPPSIGNSLTEAEAAPPTDRRHNQPAELEAGAEGEGTPPASEAYFSLRHCDSASLSSFSLDTPSLPRKHHAQEDTDSLVSTGTLVPEAIYLPPAGHRLVTHGDWDALNAQVSELRGETSRLQTEKEELERELDTQTNHTHKQVSMLQCQVHTSEALLQDIQKAFSQSQNAVQSRLGAHCEERLRIEIVHLQEQLDTRTEENDVLGVQLSSLKTETERIQSQREQLHAELLACRTEVEALRVALSHVQSTNKALSNDKASLHQQCLELRSQVISLRSQVDTTQTVQKDFVQLSQSLQVKLELIRQAESLEQVREILEEGVSEASSPPADAS